MGGLQVLEAALFVPESDPAGQPRIVARSAPPPDGDVDGLRSGDATNQLSGAVVGLDDCWRLGAYAAVHALIVDQHLRADLAGFDEPPRRQTYAWWDGLTP